MTSDAPLESRFELLERVGRGSFGEVFRGKDRATGADVAIKRLHAHVRDDVAVERFHRESRLLARIESPHVVRYVAHGPDAEGSPCLVVEWLDGEDLAVRAKRAPLTGAEILDVSRQIALGLAALHASGIVHRDVKPSNVYLVASPSGAPLAKLIDLGVARTATEQTLTMDGIAIGTPYYMSPEQARGDDDVGPASDLFSLAAVIFELCTNIKPFRGDDLFAVLAKIVLADPPRLAAALPDAPPELDALVLRAMAKSPSDRFASAFELADALALVPPFRATTALAPAGDGGATVQHTSGLTGSLEQRVVTGLFAKLPLSLEDALPNHLVPQGPSEREGAKAVFTRIALDAGGSPHVLLGPNVVAVFGRNRTLGDEATRAARAALALALEIPGARVAIATGRAVAGGAALEGDVIERGAAALERARPGAALVDDVTARLLGGSFDVEERSEGKVLLAPRSSSTGSVPPPSVVVPRTFLGKSSPCVGRERELAALESLFRDVASESVARAVLLTGGPGAGKSRLRQELLERIGGRAALLLVGRADPLAKGSAFALVGTAIRRHVSQVDAGADDDLARFDAVIGRFVAPARRHEVVARIGEIAGVRAPESGRVADAMLAADRMRAAWVTWLDAESRKGPVIVVLEDLHDGDVPSVRLVDAALQALTERPLFVVALARPEVGERFPDVWSDRALLRMPLSGLSRRVAEGLARNALGLPERDPLVARLVARAEGNPFFLEELIRAVVEHGPDAALPDTVLGVVQARLDGLGAEARRTLRAASVFGETFWRGGLMAVLGAARLATTAVDELAELCRREVVTARAEARFAGEDEFVFRHAIVREAAYAMFTDEDRALAHGLAAAWLERAGEHDAVALAEHHERAGDQAGAARHYLVAAEQALRGGDFVQAVACAERVARGGGDLAGQAFLVAAEAHRWSGHLPEASRAAIAAAEQLVPGSAPWFHAIRETIAANGRLGELDVVEAWARESSETIAELEARGAQLASLPAAAVHLTYAGKHASAEQIARRVEALFKQASRVEPVVEARVHQLRAIRASHGDDAETALEEHRAALSAFERAGDRRNAALTRSNLAFAEAQLGDLDAAEESLRAALAAAEEMRLTTIGPSALHNLGLVLAFQGALEEAREVEARAVEAFARQKDPRLEGASRIYLSRILLELDDPEGAEREARTVLEAGASGGLRIGALAMLARTLVHRRRFAEALDSARRANELLAEHDVEEFDALARLAWIEALDAAGLPDEARTAAQQAARRIRARAASLRASARREQFVALPDHARTLSLAAALDARAAPR